MKNVLVETTESRTVVRLNRPNERNAFNAELMAELTEVFKNLDSETRVVVLTGEGPAFCAGADLNYMKACANYSAAENRRDATALADLFKAIDEAPQVVIGRVNGVAMGGGLGLIACCDLVAAVDIARFGFTEVRLGLVPAVIAPYVMRKIGISHARRYFTSGDLFGAHAAYGLGLVHKVVEPARLDHAVNEWCDSIAKCGPLAVRSAKELVRTVGTLSEADAREYTIDMIARLRVDAEAQEGLEAFLEKRKPDWAV